MPYKITYDKADPQNYKHCYLIFNGSTVGFYSYQRGPNNAQSLTQVSVTLGSMLTRLLRSSYSFSPKCTLLLSTLVFLLSTLLSSIILAKSTTSSWSHIVPSFTFFSFCLSELSLGLYFPSMATIRRCFFLIIPPFKFSKHIFHQRWNDSIPQ